MHATGHLQSGALLKPKTNKGQSMRRDGFVNQRLKCIDKWFQSGGSSLISRVCCIEQGGAFEGEDRSPCSPLLALLQLQCCKISDVSDKYIKSKWETMQ